MTFKAAAALKNCTRVFVPGEMAAQLARPYCQPEILQFPMIENKEELERIWRENADTVASAAATAGCAGFACIGDVNTFSTFSHLERMIRQHHPHIEIETIPGVGVCPPWPRASPPLWRGPLRSRTARLWRRSSG